MEVILGLLAILGAAGGAGALVINNLYYICQPSEVLIFAGSARPLDDNRIAGYRLVKGGSSIRLPLLERAYRMDLTNMIIELRVTNAYSKGGIPLKVEGVANIKIAGTEPTIHNAIERLLGKTRKEIEKIAQETLEGNLRGVLASLTPEQINEDKIAFAKSLLEEAEDDLEKLGLVLDNLQIQNISDDVRYLDSIGRKQRAELVRDARIAEAKAKAQSVIRTAENDQSTSIKRIASQVEMTRAEANRRIQDAKTMRAALVAEAEAEIGSEVARTQADVAVQTERIKQVEQQLQADVVAPAEAQCKRAIAEAKGKASAIIEDGKAQAMGTKRLAESWKAAGPSAREIFLLQKLEPLLKTMVSTVPDVRIQNLTSIDTTNGNTAGKMASFLEQLRASTGVDVAGVVRNFGSGDRTDLQEVTFSTPPKLPDTHILSTAAPAAQKLPGTKTMTGQEAVTPMNALYAEVQAFLETLSQGNPSSAVAEQAIEQYINFNSNLKNQLQKLKELGGTEAVRAVFDHPSLHVPVGMIEKWIAK
ncbi:flotillin family protein [Laspinema olomoucense]|uniref:SPFH domain-containing protein n=1 Tax=Laspinema olomoucense D3b TaxID=2953688 RepID=A0ABT2N2M8_9CYAN|nr:SPFH domain-containing protein [Laspinema sp. D3b]MCT7976917.1 SPFH domain-containing protein [Laspinema sp. D3b]